MADNRIELRNIAFGYGKTMLFQELSATFEGKEFCAIVGPNGSGKSTLIKCICRLLPLQQGDIVVNGKPIGQYDSVELARLVSYVPQHQENVFDISVYDLVMMGLYPYQKKWQMGNAKDDEVVREMLRRCNLFHLKDRMLRELSGGEAQRALIARAMAQQTPIILLDEPLSNLDVAHRYEIMDILAQLNKQGVMILMVIHEFPIALEYATHALLMKSGEICAHGDVNAVMTPENIRKCFDLGSEYAVSETGNVSKNRV